jgi:hypothetical protein
MENKLKLMTAKSYSGAERIGEPFEKNGKLYQKIREKCDRCNGRGDYWWGAMINGRPQFSGTCYACNGARYFIKEVRLYTEQEFERMEAANERARQKKAEEQEKKMKAEFEEKRLAWLEKNNFSADGYTYIITGDSYSIKDELKAGGWRFDPVIKWHKADPTGYEDRVIKIYVEDCFEGSAWGDYHYKTGSKDYIDNLLAAAQPQVESNWIGEVGDKVSNLTVQLVRKYTMDGKYGVTTLYGFQDKDGNIINWWSSTFQEVEQGDWVIIVRATIKKLDTYKDVKQTVITRAKLGQISD